MLTTEIKGSATVFRRDYDGRALYSIGLSQKKTDGTWENGYMNAQFRKGVEVDDKTKIKVTRAWLKFYKKNGVTVPYIFVSDFELEEGSKLKPIEAPSGFEQIQEDVPF